MIKLTNASDGKPTRIIVEHIVEISEGKDGTSYIDLVNRTDPSENAKHVKESPEEVGRKVLEYRLKTERVKGLAHRWAHADTLDEVRTVTNTLEAWENGLHNLAGLEE